MDEDILIVNPANLSISVLEIVDERLPSFRCELRCRFKLSDGEFSYQSRSVWVDCSVVDAFLSALRQIAKGDNVEACLSDMDRQFFYRVSHESGVIVSIQGSRGVEANAELEFEFDPDTDFVPQHIESLESFAKWW